MLHDKLEIESKLDSEVSDRKRWEEKNGVLKMQLDQEIAANELLKSKLASGLSQSDAKQIIKEQLVNDQNNDNAKETNEVNKKQIDNKEEIKKSVNPSQDNIESNIAGSNKFQNEEYVENQTKSNSRLKSKKGSDDMKISLT